MADYFGRIVTEPLPSKHPARDAHLPAISAKTFAEWVEVAPERIVDVQFNRQTRTVWVIVTPDEDAGYGHGV